MKDLHHHVLDAFQDVGLLTPQPAALIDRQALVENCGSRESDCAAEAHTDESGGGPLEAAADFFKRRIGAVQQAPGHISQHLEKLRHGRKRKPARSQAVLLVATEESATSGGSTGSSLQKGEKKQRSSTMRENFIAGASASFLSKLILQPFDTTKTILQSSANIQTGYKNVVDCAVGVVKTQGVTGLYRGFGASIGTSAPSSAIFFATYEAVKKWTEANFPDTLGKVGPIVGAAVGNVISSVVRVPPEVVKQRVQARVYPNMITAITEMSRTEGIGGFYTGYGIQLARDIPYAAIQFMTFETLKKAYGVNKPHLEGESKRPAVSEARKVLTNLWMGAVAGLVASVVTTPMDVVKTRVMTQDLTQGAVKIGVRQTVRSILKHEGPLAFTYGMLPRVLLKVPASALFLVAYEGMKRLLIALEVTEQAAKLVKQRAAQEARELARKAKQAAKLKRQEEQKVQADGAFRTDAEFLLDERGFENISSPRGSPRGISEAMLASIMLSAPASKRLKSSLRLKRIIARRKGVKK